ncbi:MAG: Ig-like domain-containing protein [Planctomycetes bacterium]|nr:Ig-like domain-containing protein [Planctomycetota bacterium]
MTRSYDSFEDAAVEAGRSRIYGGIHYEFTNQASQVVGAEIGNWVLNAFDIAEDVQAPKVTVAAPPDNQVATTNITLTGKVLDNLSGVASLTAKLDNGSYAAVAFDSAGNFSLPTNLALNGSADGKHTFTLIATDNAGNASAPLVYTFSLDTQNPVITVSLPGAGATLVQGSLLSGTANPTGSTLVSLSYVFDAGTQQAGSVMPVIFEPTTGAFSQVLDISKLAVGAHTLTVTATDAGGYVASSVINVTLPEAPPLRIADLTPADGAEEIGVTYRPKITFTRPIDKSTLTTSNFYATDSTGQVIPSNLVVSDDGTYAVLLFTEAMPGGSTVTLHVNGDTILPAPGTTGGSLDADDDGIAGGVFESSFTTVSLAPLTGTTLSGVVVDPGTDKKPNTFDDTRAGADQTLMTADDVYLNPIVHAHVYIIGFEGVDGFDTYTNAQGQFSFATVPAGDIKLVVDGRTATNAPSGVFFPEMVMDLQLLAGTDNHVMDAMALTLGHHTNTGAKATFLPRLATSILKPVSNSVPTVVVADEASAPDLSPEQRALLTITIQPGTAIGFDGQPIANPTVGIATVPAELVREMLPPGLLQHSFDITIQAPGVAVFSIPAAITFPNVFGAAPGTKLNLLSFDHTTGRLVLDGTATVTADGKAVVSDPGSGVTHPGWHGQPPPGDPNDDDDDDDDDNNDDNDNDDDGDPDDSDPDDDNDGTPDDGDDDDDNDGTPDGDEDNDGDGDPDDSDPDDDNDGDPDDSDDDDDNDGTPDDEEDNDGDGDPDISDPDDDNDGTPDAGDTDDDGDGTPDDQEQPGSSQTADPVVLPMITGQLGLFPTLAWSAPAKVVSDPAPKQQPYLKVTIDVDGPLSDYMSPAGDLALDSQTFTLSAGSGDTKVFGGFAKLYDELYGPGGIMNLNRDQLYGSKVKITEEAGQAGGAVNTTIKTYYLYRWVDVVDPIHAQLQDGATAQFARTLADGSGGFVRQKNVDAHVPTGFATEFESGDLLSTAFGYGVGVSGSTTATWTFDPYLSGKRTDTIEIHAEGLDVGALTAQGTATNKTKISINADGYKAELGRVIQAFKPAVFPGADLAFGTGDDVNFIIYDYGGGVANGRVTFGADGLPGAAGVDDNGDGTVDDFREFGSGDDNTRIVSFTFQGAFASVMPGTGYSQSTLDAVLSDQAAQLQAAVAADYAGVAMGYEVVASNSGADVTMNWKDLGTGYYGLADFDLDKPYLGAFLATPSIGEAAKEIALAEGLNIKASNSGNFAVGINVSEKSTGSFAQFMANTVSHELAHTFGVYDAYLNGTGGATNVDPPNDLMRAGNDFDGDLTFATFNLNILKAAQGIQDNGDTPLTADVTLYRNNFNLPGSATGIRDETSVLAPVLGVASGGADLLPGQTVELGEAVADGTGGALITRNVTLTNTGLADLTLGSAALTGGAAGFSITSASVAGTVLTPGQSATVTVRFDPTAIGAFGDTLRITSDSDGATTFDVPLHASSYAQAATAVAKIAANNNLGGARAGQGTNQQTQVFTISNSGAQPLTLSAFTFAQGGEQFAFLGLPSDLSTNPITLARGQSFTFGLSFSPDATGLQRAAINVATNDAGQSVLHLGAVGTGLAGVVKADWGNDYVAVQIGDAAPLHTRTDAGGAFHVFLPSLSRYRTTIFDPQTRLVGMTTGKTGPSGTKTSLARDMRFDASTAPDTDYDGLPDDIELAIGSAPNRADSDKDGLSDAFEIEQGLDPLGGLGIPVGIVAAVPLQGEAKDIVVAGSTTDPAGQLAYLATGSNGLAIVDVTNFRTPVVRGQITLPGGGVSVSVDSGLGIAAVASTTGLNLVNVANPASPALLRTIDFAAEKVEVFDGVAYAIAGSALRAYELTSGEELQRLPLGNSITAFAREGETLYTVDSANVLRVIDISGPTAVLRGSLTLTASGGEMFVGNGLAYVGAETGFNGGFSVANVSNPAAPTLVSGPDLTSLAGRAIALNGSGLGVSVGKPGNGNNVLHLLNTTDPANTGSLVTAINLPAFPRAVALAAGIALVADDTAGLQVVNYRDFDNLGNPPTVTISSSIADAAPGTDGVQVEEGAVIPIAGQIADDVQVRSVEVLVNGQVVRNDVSFPFDLNVTAPLLSSGTTAIRVEVRVTDTGGNSTLSSPLNFGVIADQTPPTIVGVFPAEGVTGSQSLRIIRLDFSEPVNRATINASTVKLLGSDNLPLTPTSIQFRRNDRTVMLTYAALGDGAHQVRANTTAIKDRAGNAVGGAEFVSNFSVGQASIGWINTAGGFWDDPANWDAGRVPGANDDVIIDVPGDVAITFRQGDVTIAGLTSNNPFTITGGNLTVTGTVQVNNTFTLGGGTLHNTHILAGTGGQGVTIAGSNATLDGVTSDANLNLTTASTAVTITNGLTLNGILTLGANYTRAVFNGTQTLGGTGSVVFGDFYANPLIVGQTGTTLTIGPNMTIHGGSAQGYGGQIGYSDYFGGGNNTSIINQGTINADVNATGLTIRIPGTGTTTNAGSMLATNGGSLRVDALRNQAGKTVTATASTLRLEGAWDNDGTISLTNSTLNLGGTFANADIGTLNRTGGAVNLTGVLTNTGATLALDAATGSWNLAGGTIAGGTVSATGGAALTATTSGGTLDGVILSADLNLTTASALVTVTNGLTLNGVLTLGANYTRVTFNGTQTLGGTGSVVFGDFYANPLIVGQTGTTLTIGPNMMIHGGSAQGYGGQIGYSDYFGGGNNTSIINQGTINADVNATGLTVRIPGTGTTTNAGSMLATNGGSLRVDALRNQAGKTVTATASSLRLEGAWDNDGTISVTNSTVTLGGTFATGDIGTLNRTGGTVNLTGVLTNTGATLALNAATGSWNLVGGTIIGGTVTATGGAALTATTSGGTLDGVILSADLNLTTASALVTVTNGLTLNGVLTLGANYTRAIFSGTQTLGGTGSVVFGDFYANTLNVNQSGTALTIGPNMTIHGGSAQGYGGQIGYSDYFGGGNNISIISQGTINADVNATGLTVRATGTGTTTNAGSMLATNGGSLRVDALRNQAGRTVAATASTLRFEGVWDNDGTISVTNSTLNLGGTFANADIGTLNRTGGTVNLTGVLTNTGATLALSAATGSWNLTGGTILGGTVTATGGAALTATTSGGTLDGVILSGDLNLSTASALVTVTNGLTLNGILTLGANYTRVIFSGTQTLGGTGSVVFGDFYANTLYANQNNTTLTIGSSMTVHGGSAQGYGGQIGYSDYFGGGTNVALVNQGTINADVNATSLTIKPTGVGTFINSGSLQATNGGTLNLTGIWDNNGTLSETNSTLNLNGAFTTADIGTFSRTGGTVNLTGVLTNTGNTLALNTTTGSWNLVSGTIIGGTVTATGGAALTATASGGTLNGVTLSTDLNLTTINANVTVTNGLTLNGVLTLGANYTRIYFSGTQTLGGTGSVVFGDFYANNLNVNQAGSTLTIGSGMTIHGGSAQGYGGQIGYSDYYGGGNNVSIINQGAINADVNATGLALRPTGTGVFTNSGSAQATNGGTLNLTGTWDNNGTLSETNSTLNLNGAFTTPDIGTFSRTGGTVNLTGALTNTGNTLALNTTTGSWNLAGGSIIGGTVTATGGAALVATTTGGTLNGVTLSTDLNLTTANTNVTVTNGLTLNGVLTLGANYTRIYFSGTQTLGGTGSVVFGDFYANALNVSQNNTTLTIGSSMTIHGGSAQGYGGQIGYSDYFGGGTNVALVNQGTINADVNATSLTIKPAGVGTFINSGSLQATNGGTLNLTGTWDNNGTLSETNSTLNLNGAFTTPDIGTFSRTGGTVNLTGTLTNTGNTLALNTTTGSWNLAGGSIIGGTVTATGGAALTATATGGTLNGVTLSTDLNLTTINANVTVTNGLTLNGVLTLGANYTRIYFSGTQTLGGTGSVVFGDFYANALSVNQNNTTLTIGSSMTIRGGSAQGYGGQIGYSDYFGGGANVSIINQGTVNCDVATTSLTLRAAGTGTVTNAGTIHASKWAVARVVGAFTNGVAGIISLDVAGTSASLYGSLAVTGAATLAGTLRVNLVDGYVPVAASTFDLVLYSSVTGTFGTIDDGIATLNPSYGATKLTLTAL